MKINNKDGLVLLPLALFLGIILSTLYAYIFYKDYQMSVLEKNFKENIKLNSVAGKSDLMSGINNNNRVTNSKLTKFGNQVYDSGTGTTDDFGILGNQLSDETANAIENTNIIDKVITNKTTQITRLDVDTPNKGNNVFELDLVNFVDKNNNNVNTLALSDLKFLWGTSSGNATDVYVIMTRLKKGTTIDLNNAFEKELSKKGFGTHGNFDITDTPNNNLAVDYIKLDKPTSCSISDKDIAEYTFRWCGQEDLYDILSNRNFDLQNYMYRVFLVFGQKIDGTGNQDTTPFKIYSSSNGTFGVGNFVQADLTMITGDNSKKRVYINTATKNNILPYLINSLWVNGKIELENEDT